MIASEFSPHLGSSPSLAGTSWLEAISTQYILSILENAGFEARIVGGAVRNALLGQPVKDIDIATTAIPEEVSIIAERAGLGVISVGSLYGTVIVRSYDKDFEITTLREDIVTNGRHAEVRFIKAWETDAQRRDFTVNAIYCDKRGNIFDPLNGLKDLASSTIRFIGCPDRRISEDYLRILRFFRFFAQYGNGSPDRSSLEACVRGREGLHKLSRDRIRQEFLKLLAAPNAVASIDSMQSHGLLCILLPVVPRVTHLARLISRAPNSSYALRLATLCLTVAEDVEQVSKALKLSKMDKKDLENIAEVLCFQSTPPTPYLVRQSIYNHGREKVKQRLHYLRSVSLKSDTNTDWNQLEELANTWAVPKFPITGHDILLLAELTGPKLGEIIRETKANWIRSDFALSSDSLLAYAKDLVRKAKKNNQLLGKTENSS